MLERFPGDLEQQALLRVHGRGFARRDPEKGRVEAADVIEEAAIAGRHLRRRIGIGVKQCVDVPAIGRNLADRIAAVAQQRPERLRIVGSAGKAAAETDHRDRLVGAALLGLDLVVELDGEQRQALGRQIGDAIEEVAHVTPSFRRRAANRRSTSSSLRSSMARTVFGTDGGA